MVELKDLYFKWLVRHVDTKQYHTKKYDLLLNHLHSVFFISLIDMDENREYDGIDLRYRFGYERDIPPEDIHQYIDTRPCTVLEMMIALSLRVEEHIMYDDDVGNQTGRWFWDMVTSLGLINMTDERYDADQVSRTIDRFIKRKYSRNGKGGLVTLPDCSEDLRKVEIWYQIQWYLNSIAKEMG